MRWFNRIQCRSTWLRQNRIFTIFSRPQFCNLIGVHSIIILFRRATLISKEMIKLRCAHWCGVRMYNERLRFDRVVEYYYNMLLLYSSSAVSCPSTPKGLLCVPYTTEGNVDGVRRSRCCIQCYTYIILSSLFLTLLLFYDPLEHAVIAICVYNICDQRCVHIQFKLEGLAVHYILCSSNKCFGS